MLLPSGQLAHSGISFLFERYAADRFSRLDAALIEAAEQGQRFEQGEFFREPGFLERDADLLPDLVISLAPVHSQHFDFSASGCEESFQDLNGCGLSRAVGAKESETFTGAYRQIETVDGIDRRFAGVLFIKLTADNGIHMGGTLYAGLYNDGDAMKTKAWIPALILLTAVLCLTARQSESLTEKQIRDMVRESADRDLENTRRQRDYTYVQRTEQRRKGRDGRVNSTESTTYEIMILSGEPTRKVIAKDDKPLSAKEARKEEERIQKLIEKFQKEDDGTRRRRLLKSEKSAEEDREFVREIADAYRFRFVGMEPVDGRTAYVIDADPIVGYKARHKDANNLEKFRFRAWVDVAERQWVKLDIESIDTVSWGLFLARLAKGSKIRVEQTRVNDEVWLPKHVAVDLDARIVLLKKLSMDIDVTFRDYRKFVTNSVIRPLGEAVEGAQK